MSATISDSLCVNEIQENQDLIKPKARIPSGDDKENQITVREEVKVPEDLNKPCVTRPWNCAIKESEKFEHLVLCYHEHLRFMQIAMTPVESFLTQHDTGIKLRKFQPTDVEKLSTTELSGLLYWLEKMEPWKDFDAADRAVLFKRYSVRKLSLDHFYVCSKWEEEIRAGNFVMPNNTFLLPGQTGFEGIDDDEKMVAAKKEIFLPTFERMWRCAIGPFSELKISDAEIVYLHFQLLFSGQNDSHVQPPTKERMKEAREWAVQALFKHYENSGVADPELRYGAIAMLLPEIEVICNQHCQDFAVAKLFEFCDMSQYWYEKWCYSDVNTKQQL